MESMINRWEIEREDTLTPKVQKLNQKVHCRARGRHVACSSRAIATRRRRHTVKNHFVPLLTLLNCLFLRHRDALDGKRSFSDHARTTRGHERDIVHNQAFTNSPPPSTPPPPLGALPLLPPAPPARAPPAQAPQAPQLRRGKTSKVHCTG